MKKFVKVFSVIMLVVNLLILAVSILALSRPEAIGEWIVSFYEELTNDLGHTVQGMYAKLSLIASISGCLALIASTVLCETCYFYVCKCEKHCHCVESEGTDVKSEEENSEVHMARMSREEKALLRAERKAARLAKKAIKHAISKEEAPVEEVKEQPVSSAAVKTKRAEDFLANLKNKK